MPPDQGVAHVVDPLTTNVGAQQQLIPQVRAEVVIGELHLVPADAIGERDAKAKVGRIQVAAAVVQVQPRHSGSFDVQLPTLRVHGAAIAEAQDARAPAQRDVLEPAAAVEVLEPDAGKARLLGAGQIRAIDQALGD